MRAMPPAWFLFSVVYLVFILGIEDRQMPGADWDPGSTALPMGVAVFMILCSLYLTAKDVIGVRALRRTTADPDSSGSEPSRSAVSTTPDRATRRLAWLSVISTIAYVLAFRVLGFVISTTIMLYVLTFYYQLGDLRPTYSRVAIRYAIFSVFGTAALYALGVWALRWVRYFGRIYEIPILRERAFSAIVGALIWIGILYPVFRRVLRDNKSRSQPIREARRALVLATTTTLALFLVFQQLFRVTLAAGILL